MGDRVIDEFFDHLSDNGLALDPSHAQLVDHLDNLLALIVDHSDYPIQVVKPDKPLHFPLQQHGVPGYRGERSLEWRAW